MRAVIEGVTFSLKDVLVLLEKMLRKTFTEIISVGGGAKNKEWAQIQADVFDAEIFALDVEEGPSMGAAMIAAVGVGWFDSLEICAKSFVSYHKVATPITENVRTYQKIYSIYQQVYGQTKVISHELRAFDDENVEEE
ncbi:Xylulose kinase [bioreactor metagenome]|uniref:Xylulose kinase n=1 Tax=bioreactor metagenome TaxID=1076179 RepID=A0A645CDS8_9ZZZZ